MQLTPEDKLLLSVVKLHPSADELEIINGLIPLITDWEGFIENLIAHGSAPLLFKKLTLLSNHQQIPAEVKLKLQQAYYRTLTRSMVLYEGFATVAKALTTAGIKVIALKGVYLSECLYGDIALRQFSDMDVLVKEEDGEQCLTILESMGFRPYDPSVSDFIAEQTEIVHHTPMVKGDLSVEIHIRLHRKNKQYAVQTPDFIEHAVPVTIHKTNVFALQLYDLLIHLCVHLDKHFAGGHIQMKCFNDIVNLLSVNEKTMDWNQFVIACKYNACENLVMKYLMMSHEFYGASLPVNIRTQYEELLTENEKHKFIEYLHGVEEKKYHVTTHWQNIHGISSTVKKIRYFIELIFPPKKFMISKYLESKEQRAKIKDGKKNKVCSEEKMDCKLNTANWKQKFWWLWYPYRWWVGVKGIIKLIVKALQIGNTNQKTK